jgi:hypothetical protein
MTGPPGLSDVQAASPLLLAASPRLAIDRPHGIINAGVTERGAQPMIRRIILVAWAALYAVPVGAADAADPRLEKLVPHVRKDGSGGFFTIRTSRYVIKSDVDEAFTAEATLYMADFYKAFRSFFKPPPRLRAVPTVYLLRDRKSFHAFCDQRDFPEQLKGSGGFYYGGARSSELVLWHNRPGTGFGGFPKQAIRHEGAHQLLSYIIGTHRIPIWYNEGVATFFESWDVGKPWKENLEHLQATHSRFPRIIRTFGTENFIDLHHLMQLTRKTWVPDKFGPVTAQHYAEVQSFMTFLLVSKKGRTFFAMIFRCVAAGQNPADRMSRKLIASAQRAWYKDIERRIALAKGKER